jgi:hypothetical protein
MEWMLAEEIQAVEEKFSAAFTLNQTFQEGAVIFVMGGL